MWFKIDDGWWRGLKMRKLSKRRRVRVCEQVAAAGLWALAGDWSSDQLSDGRVPWEQIDEWDPDRVATALLVDAQFWTSTEEGIEFHDWSDWNPTRDEVEQKRAETRDRVARHRRRVPADLPVSNHDVNLDVSGDVSREKLAAEIGAFETAAQVEDACNALQPSYNRVSNTAPTRPDPTRPDQRGVNPPLFPPRPVDPRPRRAAVAVVEPDRFAEFWAAYPRKIDKRKAETAWRAALKRGADPDTVITAAAAYRAATADRERHYVKHPTSWLNAAAYDNEPERETPTLRRVNGRPNVDDKIAAWQALKDTPPASKLFPATTRTSCVDAEILGIEVSQC